MQESTAEFVVSQMYFKEQWTSDPIISPPLLQIKFKGTPTTTKKMIKIPCIVQELLYNAKKTGQSAHSALGKREK